MLSIVLCNLRLDISVENSVSVHVIDCLDNLVHVEFGLSFWQVMSASFNCFIQIHVHQLKNQS